jgi:hypothetical protein
MLQHVKAAAVKPLALELRHNDEAVGRVFAGAVDIPDDDVVIHAEARFWAGLRGMRSRVALAGSLLPRPRAELVLLVVR